MNLGKLWIKASDLFPPVSISAPTLHGSDSPGKIELVFRVCITLITVLWLACAVRNSLSYLFGHTEERHAAFRLQAIGNQDFGSMDQRSDLLVRALIVDGQRLRWDSVDRTNNWETIDYGRAGDPCFIYRDSSEPAILSFQGNNALIVLEPDQWSGKVIFERDGKEVRSLELPYPGQIRHSAQEYPIVLESPAAPPSTALFIGALIIFLGCAVWFGPITRARGSVPWLIFFLFVAHILFWASNCVATTGDSSGYVNVLPLLLQGIPSYFPPGYPAFLGLVGAVSGESLGRFVTLTQHVMAVFAGWWIYLFLRRITPESLALLGGILAAAMPCSLTAPQTVMTETPTLFALVGAFYFALRAMESERSLFSIPAGVLAGWAVTLRLAPLAGLFPSICLMYMLRPKRGVLRQICITFIVAAMVVSLPILWCWYKTGQASLSNSLGFHLFDRVVWEQRLLDYDGPATRNLLTILNGKDPRGIPSWEIREYEGLRELDYIEQEALLREVSFEAIRKYPRDYLKYTLLLACTDLVGDSTHSIYAWGETLSAQPRLENPPLLRFAASDVRWRLTMDEIQRFLWPILCCTAIVGAFGGLFFQQRLLILALSCVPAGYLLSSACVEAFVPRFNLAVVPFIVALSVAPISAVLNPMSARRAVNGRKERIPTETNLE
jgi:hypothetical protein